MVSRPKPVQPLSLKSYTEGALRMERTPGRLLVTWETVTVDTEITAVLDVRASERVMHLERVLLPDGVRIGLESTTAMPMLLLNRCSVDIHGVPIECVRALYRGDRVAFEARLTELNRRDQFRGAGLMDPM